MSKEFILRMVIVDDNPQIADQIEHLVLRKYPDTVILAKAISVKEALSAIRLYQPNILCLDVDLTGETSFDILDQINREEDLPAIIFITGHADYAIQALRNRADDFILKPVVRRELYAAIDKVKERIKRAYELADKEKGELKQELNNSRLSIPTLDGIIFIKVTDIVYLQAVRNYTELILKSGKKILASKTLKYFVQTLPTSLFLRAHRSYIVNILEVEAYKSADGGMLILSNGDEVKITKSQRSELQNRLL